MEQKWRKEKIIFHIPNKHTQCPVIDLLPSSLWRIYYASRNEENCSSIYFFDYDVEYETIVFNNNKPIISLGDSGRFDEHGMMPSSIYENYLFYFGISHSKSVSHLNSIGMLNLNTNQRCFNGPIISKNYTDPFYVATPYIKKIDSIFHIWYLSVFRHEYDNLFYNIKHATSNNFTNWNYEEEPCISCESDEGGIASPSVLQLNDRLTMWYCYRKSTDYRVNPNNSYKIGTATYQEHDKKWKRMDQTIHFYNSEFFPSSFDSVMMCYPNVFQYSNKYFMLLNGNEFGKTGIGYAQLIDS